MQCAPGSAANSIPQSLVSEFRPTIDNGAPLLEVHLLDFEGDLYGRDMLVGFVERIRDERKFESLDLLVTEMRRDMERAQAILAREG